MRILISNYNVEIELVKGKPLCLCIESPQMLRSVLTDIWVQTDGGSGNIILSKGGKEIALSKGAEFIINPLTISFNDKKLVNKLYQELNKIAIDEYMSEAENLNSHIINYLDFIIGKLPYRIEFDLILDIITLLKMYKVRFEEDVNEGFVEKLASYIKLVHKVCGIELFISYNLKHLLTQNEQDVLYKDLVYEQIFLLDIESSYSFRLQEESCIIIDRDECMINLV